MNDFIRESENDIEKRASLDLPELYHCVHCGLCLNQCPTYRVTRREPASPRGRIHLVKAASEGRVELNERFKDHIYLCLLCRACESACPSGVQYGRIAETAREHLGPPGSALARTIQMLAFTRLLPFPNRLKWLFAMLRLYQASGLQALLKNVLPKKLQRMQNMLPKIGRPFAPNKRVFGAVGPQRARVALLSGCVMPHLFGTVNQATVNVLRRNGCEVIIPERQTCCGALNVHNGETAVAKQMAKNNIDRFLKEPVDAIIVNAAGCGAAMKEYAYLLRGDEEYKLKVETFSALVRDAGEFLAALGLVGKLGAVPLTVTYQDPCHLAHGQKVRNQPRALLRQIPELKIVEMDGADRCCGSAGIYNLTHTGMSQQLLHEKMTAIAASESQAVVAPNPGCMVQLRHGTDQYGPNVQVFHLMDLLEQAYVAGDGAIAES